ncbi:MAG: hypothetical protein JF886_08655 [Candidatus Dormibacteraeota bacterium]|uniref:Sodium/calcium exchanger membrane region domain-containing protein n=1 Tax=Candidatus Aeolococcus gillhamiae TaxID=3127015 RepID=A0A2W5ZDI3_9BACT|nr:hypothetical protein [Candidatus Dormibacteraeota bacterium]PZR81005.1 MAG: hypothetical protein DLM65_06865 [Candidatus Dormibacter sp. RRmetagenome_bin12]
MSPVLSLVAFLGGVVVVVLATERLLKGLVGASRLLRVAPFVASALLAGLEAENVAVGLAASSRGDAEIALGTAFGGAIFLVCFALGIGALIAPLRFSLPRGIPGSWPPCPSLGDVPWRSSLSVGVVKRSSCSPAIGVGHQPDLRIGG